MLSGRHLLSSHRVVVADDADAGSGPPIRRGGRPSSSDRYNRRRRGGTASRPSLVKSATILATSPCSQASRWLWATLRRCSSSSARTGACWLWSGGRAATALRARWRALLAEATLVSSAAAV